MAETKSKYSSLTDINITPNLPFYGSAQAEIDRYNKQIRELDTKKKQALKYVKVKENTQLSANEFQKVKSTLSNSDYTVERSWSATTYKLTESGANKVNKARETECRNNFNALKNQQNKLIEDRNKFQEQYGSTIPKLPSEMAISTDKQTTQSDKKTETSAEKKSTTSSKQTSTDSSKKTTTSTTSKISDTSTVKETANTQNSKQTAKVDPSREEITVNIDYEDPFNENAINTDADYWYKVYKNKLLSKDDPNSYISMGKTYYEIFTLEWDVNDTGSLFSSTLSSATYAERDYDFYTEKCSEIERKISQEEENKRQVLANIGDTAGSTIDNIQLEHINSNIENLQKKLKSYQKQVEREETNIAVAAARIAGVRKLGNEIKELAVKELDIDEHFTNSSKQETVITSYSIEQMIKEENDAINQVCTILSISKEYAKQIKKELFSKPYTVNENGTINQQMLKEAYYEILHKDQIEIDKKECKNLLKQFWMEYYSKYVDSDGQLEANFQQNKANAQIKAFNAFDQSIKEQILINTKL